MSEYASIEAERDALKARLAEAERERDEYHARAISLFWLVPLDTISGALQQDAADAKAWIEHRRSSKTVPEFRVTEAFINGSMETKALPDAKWLGCVYGEDDDWRIYAVPIRAPLTADMAADLVDKQSDTPDPDPIF